MTAPDEPRPPFDGLDRRAFLARLGAGAAAGAVGAFLPAWVERPRLLALLPPPPRPLGVVASGLGGPVPFFDDGALPAPALARLEEERLDRRGMPRRMPSWLEITFHDWVTYWCRVQVETPSMFNPLTLPALVPLADAPPPPRLAAAIAAYRGGSAGTRCAQPRWLELSNVWTFGPGPDGAAGGVGRAESAAAMIERVFGEGSPWAAGDVAGAVRARLGAWSESAWRRGCGWTGEGTREA